MYIFVEPIGGLCNRMRCIASGYQFAKDNQYDMVIIWALRDVLNCRFRKLFCQIQLNHKSVKVIELPYDGPGILNKGHYTIGQIIKKLYKIKSRYIFEEHLGDTEIKGNIYISSSLSWYESREKICDIFAPNRKIRSVIDYYKKSFKNYMVGVHIRRTDNTLSKECSPSSMFYKKMREISNEKDCIYFIATDDELEIIKMQNAFGTEKVFSQKNINRNRSHPDGIKSALVDLFLLANCDVILGSFYSSFSEIAAQIYNKPLYIMKKD